MYLIMKKGIFEVKELDKNFYLDDQLIYPLTEDEYNQFKIFIDVNEQTNKTFLLIVKEQEVIYQVEIKEYEQNALLKIV